MNTLDGVTQQNAAMAEEASASSQLLQQEAQTLSGIVSRFQLGESLSSPSVADNWSDDEDWAQQA